ncbi:MAG TPA: membrane dipeptidase [Gemmatimonadales bacterium]|nr:membrane dipeptidase [Gemmatimonadales bacterium]
MGKELEYWAANQLLNYQAGEPRVSLQKLLAGTPGGIGSVLCDPEDEFFHDAQPVPEAFEHVLAQMANVETEVDGKATVVRNPADLRRCLESGQRFLFHCVEGAYGLGGNPDNVAALAKRGVAYVIVAHLFFRGVATCANAIPFLPDAIFERWLNPDQDPKVGLTKLGHEIVDRLFQARILVDITHCSDRAQADIFAIARGYPGQPVISSHNGVRGESDYPLNLSDDAVRRIADSGGVIGVILFPHWLRRRHHQLSGADGFPLLFDTIEYLRERTGDDHIAIGSDLDGFIKPLKGCENYAETPALVEAVQLRYGSAADKILYQNALRVLEQGWRGAV